MSLNHFGVATIVFTKPRLTDPRIDFPDGASSLNATANVVRPNSAMEDVAPLRDRNPTPHSGSHLCDDSGLDCRKDLVLCCMIVDREQ